MSAIIFLFFFKQKTAYEIGLGIPAEPLFRSVGRVVGTEEDSKRTKQAKNLGSASKAISAPTEDRKSGSAGMPRPISYAVFCLKKKKEIRDPAAHVRRQNLPFPGLPGRPGPGP